MSKTRCDFAFRVEFIANDRAIVTLLPGSDGEESEEVDREEVGYVIGGYFGRYFEGAFSPGSAPDGSVVDFDSQGVVETPEPVEAHSARPAAPKGGE